MVWSLLPRGTTKTYQWGKPWMWSYTKSWKFNTFVNINASWGLPKWNLNFFHSYVGWMEKSVIGDVVIQNLMKLSLQNFAYESCADILWTHHNVAVLNRNVNNVDIIHLIQGQYWHVMACLWCIVLGVIYHLAYTCLIDEAYSVKSYIFAHGIRLILLWQAKSMYAMCKIY